MERQPGIRTRIYTEQQLDTVLQRMAAGAAVLLAGCAPVAVVGVLRRGAPLAERLATRLRAEHGLRPVLRADLAISRYADDLTLLYPETRLQEASTALPLTGCHVLLVDDVLYTGHSLLRAVDYLVRNQAAAVRVAVLAERCVACLPLRADVVGLRLQVAPGAIVECHVPPYEPDFAIDLVMPPPSLTGAGP
jgi:pyrimidine operon attenuation protein / uracil phosphoribosyltransferase